jgi:hypothetical protein
MPVSNCLVIFQAKAKAQAKVFVLSDIKFDHIFI